MKPLYITPLILLLLVGCFQFVKNNEDDVSFTLQVMLAKYIEKKEGAERAERAKELDGYLEDLEGLNASQNGPDALKNYLEDRLLKESMEISDQIIVKRLLGKFRVEMTAKPGEDEQALITKVLTEMREVVQLYF